MRRGRILAALAGYAGLVVLLRPSGSQLPKGDWWVWLNADPERALISVLSGVGSLVAAWLFAVTCLSVVAATSTCSGRLAGRLVRFDCAGHRSRGSGSCPRCCAGCRASRDGRRRPGDDRDDGWRHAQCPATPPDADRRGTGAADTRSGPPARSRPDAGSDVNAGTGTATSTVGCSTIGCGPATGPAAGRLVPNRTHQVVPGDTLWDLAAADLPPGASPAEITRAWRVGTPRIRRQSAPIPG